MKYSLIPIVMATLLTVPAFARSGGGARMGGGHFSGGGFGGARSGAVMRGTGGWRHSGSVARPGRSVMRPQGSGRIWRPVQPVAPVSSLGFGGSAITGFRRPPYAFRPYWGPTFTFTSSYVPMYYGLGSFYDPFVWRSPFMSLYNPYWYAPFGFYPQAYSGSSFSEKRGEIRLDTKDPTLDVYIDGAFAGKSGDLKKIKLEPGLYNIELRASDGASDERKVYVVPGKKVKIEPNLQSALR